MSKLIADKEFNGLNYSDSKFEKGNYENCIFKNCNFENAILSDVEFLECEFENCNLSMINTTNTAFKEITVSNCKMIGVHFETCSKFLFSMNFASCQLNLSSFYQMNLTNCKFINSSLEEVDFVASDLTEIGLSGCNLSGAIFENTLLKKADLSNAFNFTINPEINNINKAKFSTSGLIGLLSKYNIIVK